MMAAGAGSLVLVGSQLAHIGAPGYASYTAAKGGVTALARALAADAGPRGVRVNVLAPGVVQTPLAYVNRPDFDDQIDAIAARHPLRRIGAPEDMGGPAVFLLSRRQRVDDRPDADRGRRLHDPVSAAAAGAARA